MCNCTCQCNNFNQFNNHGFGIQPMGISPMGGFGGFDPDPNPFAEEKEADRKQRIIKKALERHAPAKVIGGVVIDGREDFANNRFYALVEETVDEDGFEGTKRHEAYINADSAAGLVGLSDNFYIGRPVIFDPKTGRLLEALWVVG